MTDGTTNASLRKGDVVESIDIERASELLGERRAAGPSTRKKKAAKKAAPAKKKATAKKATAKKAGAKKAAAKKARAPKKAAVRAIAARRLRRPNRSEMPARGRLIALEGIDGCGKSTQARALAEALGARLTFEPGATPVGARLRELLLAPDAPPPSPRTEALLMAADRAEHVARVAGARPGRGRVGGQRPLRRVDHRLPGLRAGPRPRRAGRAGPVGHRRAGRRPLDPGRRQRRGGGGPPGRAAAGGGPTGWSGWGRTSPARVREGFLAQAAADPDALGRRRRDGGGAPR